MVTTVYAPSGSALAAGGYLRLFAGQYASTTPLQSAPASPPANAYPPSSSASSPSSSSATNSASPSYPASAYATTGYAARPTASSAGSAASYGGGLQTATYPGINAALLVPAP